MILNISELQLGTVFHFQHSLAPFTLVYVDNEPMFLNLDTFEVISEVDLNWQGYAFYPDHCVEADGKLDWVE